MCENEIIYANIHGRYFKALWRCHFTEQIKRETICGGVDFIEVPGDKFKQNYLMVCFQIPLSDKTAAWGAILPMVLRRGCREYPNMTALNRKLSELYGASIDGGADKHGESQLITVSCEMLADSFALNSEKVLESCAKLLCSVIFDPVVNAGAFAEKTIEIEKKNLVDLIDSRLNDKRKYATSRIKEEMCANEAYGISELGRREDMGKISPSSLYTFWQSVISSARTVIIFEGTGDTQPVKRLFADAFSKVRKGDIMQCKTEVVRAPSGKTKTVTEYMQIVQAKLIMGLRTGTVSPENTDALQLACTIFGGSASAKLFLNVREKLSLCYYCMSYIDRIKGLMFIDCGIAPQNFEAARDEILRQLADLQDGKITEEELSNAALTLKNAFTSIDDSLGALAVWYASRAFTGDMRAPSKAAEDIMKVTRDDVIAAAKRIKLDTIYLLSGKEDA